eukprot:TRINITY_DN18927_c0_g1_i2.p1 TRINITY_DN18927_c0_g1~~TRINITY_DN18927_c0_g1_i2.p1  ORF type:complete len:866 (+),score=133.13 TRINITY_DN18927_c0_g1_i2:64-2661(+)
MGLRTSGPSSLCRKHRRRRHRRRRYQSCTRKTDRRFTRFVKLAVGWWPLAFVRGSGLVTGSCAASVSNATSSSSASAAVPATEGSCWHAGYTREICCRPKATVNCWDAVFTYRRCCSPLSPNESTDLQTVSLASNEAPLSASVSGIDVAAGSLPKADNAASVHGSVSGKDDCWRGGYTFARCCEVPSIVASIDGCWDATLTEDHCCGRVVKSDADAFAMSRGNVFHHGAEVPGELAAPGEPRATSDAAGMAGVSRNSGGPSGSFDATANDLGSMRGDYRVDTDVNVYARNDDASRARFLRRENERRWPAYFRKAHFLLNEVLGGPGGVAGVKEPGDAAGGKSDGAATAGESAPQNVAERAPFLDEVQLYHLLYEVVNQVVAGVQLASEASGRGVGMPASGDRLGDVGGSRELAAGGDSTLRAAFLSASVVLARLAKASVGTSLEHEEFGAQAGAAMALSCRQQDQAAFNEDVTNRIRWLQLETGAGSGGAPAWSQPLLEGLQRRLNDTEKEGRPVRNGPTSEQMDGVFQRSWQMYSEDLAEAVWRPAANSRTSRTVDQTTLDPLDERLTRGSSGRSHMWEVFPTYIMAKPLQNTFSGGTESPSSCSSCPALTRIVLEKYDLFSRVLQNDSATSSSAGARPRLRRMRSDEVNNAFFGWQLTHDAEQDDRGAQLWPELYTESREFADLKRQLKLSCLEYLQQVYDESLSIDDLQQLDLSIWASVTHTADDADRGPSSGAMGLAFHDHPLALLSGVFYAQAGGVTVEERTPTVFADPRGTSAFRYTSRRPQARRQRTRSVPEDVPLEPTAPFHRLAYAHASDGQMLIFPSWVVHGVPPHVGKMPRVVFAFNLHSLPGTTLSSWAKTAL